VLGLPAPLRPATLAAADRVFADLYSDADAHSALTDALPALASRNPREIKRFVNLFRFYSFIAERQRLIGAEAPGEDQLAKLAAFAIRWPHVISMLSATDSGHLLNELERAARAGDGRWPQVLGEVFPAFAPGEDGEGKAVPAGWGDDLRRFLRDGVEIGPVAHRFL
jgi:hypothetical protein